MDPSFVDPALAGNPSCTEDLATGSAADLWTVLDMCDGTPGPGTCPNTDLNFTNVTTFGPKDSTITPGTSLTVGDKVGGLRSLTTLGLFNGICNPGTSFFIEFIFYNIALPNVPSDPRASTNIAWSQEEGSPNRFEKWNFDNNGDHFANSGKGHYQATGTGTVVASTTPVQAPGTSTLFTNYPIWLLDLFDPDFKPGNFDPLKGAVTGADGSAKPILPIAVYGSITFVAGSWTPLYFVQFAAGGLTPVGGALGLMNADMGQPSVSVLTDPTAVAASPSSITDFCTPLHVETVLLGTVIGSGATRATNPSTAGTHYVTQYNASQRDLDQDSFENSIDTCATVVSADPRSASGTDTDGDGIDNIAGCDTTGAGGVDEDGDGFQNRQDNCPILSNSSNLDSEVNVTISTAQADLGPKGDSIGDACDSGSVTVVNQNWAGVGATLSHSITLSPTVSNGRYHVIYNVIPKCFGGLTDADGDGYCGSAETVDTAGAEGLVRHASWAGTHPAVQMDTDGDGWSDGAETYFGTDAVFACSADTNGGNETLKNWVIDKTDDQKVTTFDLIPYIGNLNKWIGEVSTGPDVPATREDHTLDGFISVFDLIPYIGNLNKTCADIGIPAFSPQ